MSFFSSEFECKLDAKGRLVLPAKIKGSLPEGMGNSLMLQRGFDPCLVLYPMVEFKKIYSRIMGLNEFNEEARKLQRNFMRGTAEVELDNMGRFLIPKLMLKYAQLEKEVMVVGVGNRIEIWNPESYEEHIFSDPGDYDQVAQKYLDAE